MSVWKITSGSLSAEVTADSATDAFLEAVKNAPDDTTLGFLTEAIREGDDEPIYVSTEFVLRKHGMME